MDQEQVDAPVENEELLNKIDIDDMFKKFSPVVKKTAVKPKIDMKKIAKKVVKTQDAIDKTK